MVKKLVRNDVVDLARLSRLQLSEAEIETYLSELNSILGYIEKLSDFDTEGLNPTSQVTGLENVTREDEVVLDQQASPSDLLALVPEKEKNYIKVKRMI